MSEHTPFISVICSVYNKEKFLRECLQSVLDQKFPDFELVCVDDGSTDSSPGILAEFAAKDPRIRVIRQENAGTGAALNTALDAAAGEWIAVLDADDIVPEDAYDCMVQCIIEHPMLDMVCGNAIIMANGEHKSEFVREPSGVVYGPVDGCAKDVSHGGFFIVTNLYRREFLDNNNIRFNGSRGNVYHDVGFFYFTMACAERLINTGRPSYIYRTNELSSMSHSKNQAGVLEAEFLYVIQKASSPQYKDKFKRVAPSFVKHMVSVALPFAKDRTTSDTYIHTLSKMREALLAAKSAGFDFKLLTRQENIAVNELSVSPDVYVVVNSVRTLWNTSLPKLLTQTYNDGMKAVNSALEQSHGDILQVLDTKLNLAEAASRMKTRQWEHRVFGRRWLWVLMRNEGIEIYCFGHRIITLKSC